MKLEDQGNILSELFYFCVCFECAGRWQLYWLINGIYGDMLNGDTSLMVFVVACKDQPNPF